MATYGRREVTTTRVEFPVPAEPPYGACWAEVMKAIRAAHQELWTAGLVPENQDAPDDLIKVTVSDDEVIVYYERSG